MPCVRPCTSPRPPRTAGRAISLYFPISPYMHRGPRHVARRARSSRRVAGGCAVLLQCRSGMNPLLVGSCTRAGAGWPRVAKYAHTHTHTLLYYLVCHRSAVLSFECSSFWCFIFTSLMIRFLRARIAKNSESRRTESPTRKTRHPGRAGRGRPSYSLDDTPGLAP